MAVHRKSAVILALCATLARADGVGRVTGFVKFPGETPPRNMFANASDADCPRGIPQTHLLVKQETRGLANAMVILVSKERRVMPTRLQAELSTMGCQLLPRIQWAPLGTSLLLTNKDGASHHLRAMQGDNVLFEADVKPDVPALRRPLVVPGLYRIECTRHLWERAWLYVSPHDWVAITDKDGRFLIKNVPPGRYAVRAWHEGWQEAGATRDNRPNYVPMQDSRDVSVSKNEDAEVIFDALTPGFGPSGHN